MRFLIALLLFVSCEKNSIKVIAHRGASGYLPEHTLESASMAHAFGVDYIEPDLVMTKDNRLVVLHDYHIDTTTNVAQVFPDRKRDDGRFYAVDFNLDEIKQLSITERVVLKSGAAVYPQRFPIGKSGFKVPTFEEFIELVQGLNKSRGKKIGIYPEIKNPEFHHQHDKDITAAVYDVLKKYGYEESKNAIIQCFYPPTLQRLKLEFQTKIPLVLLLAENSWNESTTDYEQIMTPDGLKQVATFVDGIGPWIPQVAKNPKLVEFAHQLGLKVHVYTHRKDDLAGDYKSEEVMLNSLINEIKVDGIFSDFPDRLIKYKGE
jgi:glycerophosphoryl diester phosphodiesterase